MAFSNMPATGMYLETARLLLTLSGDVVMNLKKILTACIVTFLVVGGIPFYASAQSDWNEVTFIASDPRDGWVVLDGFEEGQTQVAKCFDTDLKKVNMNYAGWLTYSVSEDDGLCAPDAPQANLDPSRFQDPRLTWVIAPAGSGRANPVRCFGKDLNFVEESRDGTLTWDQIPNATVCGPDKYRA